jgi:hypothetical protein
VLFLSEDTNVPEGNAANSTHEAAAAKLWAVYISQAEKYDKGLVESWKSDMQGMLIFVRRAGIVGFRVNNRVSRPVSSPRA